MAAAALITAGCGDGSDTSADSPSTVSLSDMSNEQAPPQRLLVEFTLRLVHDHTVSDEVFARIESAYGRAKFLEAIGLLGHYMTIGTVIRLFDVEPPEGTKTF